GYGAASARADRRRPTWKGGERAGHWGPLGPTPPVPFGVLGPADEIQQATAREEVVDKVRARPDPRLRADLEPEIGEAFGRDQSAIGNAAGKDWGLLTEQSGAHYRTDPIGPDQDVGFNPHAVLEPRLDKIALVLEANETATEMNLLGRKARRNDRQQISAVNGDMRSAVELFAERIERRPLEGASVLPASLVGEEWADPLAVQRSSKAQSAQNADR